MKWWAAMACVAIGLIATSTGVSAQSGATRTVVLLLFQGWAPRLVEDFPTPTLTRLRQEGSWTHHLQPAFPTTPLVDQVSMSTGCWPERHGIVGDVFVDPRRGRFDHLSDADWLTGCEHIQVAAERQGVRAATLGWVGGVSATRGNLASYVAPERAWSEPLDDRVQADEVVRLLALPDGQRPRLILARFGGPEAAVQHAGGDSKSAFEAAARSDAALAVVVGAVEKLSTRQAVTLLVASDRGLLPSTLNINIQKIAHRQLFDATTASSGATAFLYISDQAHAHEAYQRLLTYQQYIQTVFKSQQPPEYHLGNGPRVGDLIIVARPPYFLDDMQQWPWWARAWGSWGPELLWSAPVVKATSGYAPSTRGMPGFLYAWGSGIPRGREVKNLRAIDLHPTVCHLLNIHPGDPLDGTIAWALLAPELRQ